MVNRPGVTSLKSCASHKLIERGRRLRHRKLSQVGGGLDGQFPAPRAGLRSGRPRRPTESALRQDQENTARTSRSGSSSLNASRLAGALPRLASYRGECGLRLNLDPGRHHRQRQRQSPHSHE